jgi:hypothetical protein
MVVIEFRLKDFSGEKRLSVLSKEPNGEMILPFGFIDTRGTISFGDIGVSIVSLNHEDIFQLALKQAEVKEYGLEIPVCEVCGGTPNFPREVNGACCVDDCHPIVASEIEYYLEFGFDDDVNGEIVVESDA